MSGKAYFWGGLVLVLALAVNLHSWQPGVGGRRNGPRGAELERYLGWPAQFCAELWESDDVDLIGRILSSAPFYLPYGEMSLRVRYFDWRAVGIDLAFAMSAVVCACIIADCDTKQRWTKRAFAWVFILAVFMWVLYSVAGSVGAYL